jgi:aspartyl-tRNA(Asn)/glutamyl-tRNA(Gln) amidotransferase subunit C
MRISPEEVRHIATLARVGVTEADIERFSTQLSNILEHFQVLQQVDTSSIPPMSHSVALESVMRPDAPRPSLPAEETLSNAPKREGDFFRVLPVLEQ